MVKCKKCNQIFEASSNQFGYRTSCPKCNFEFVLDIDDLVKYSTPEEVHIYNKTLSEKNHAILFKYGFRLPLILPPKNPLIIYKKFLEDALHDLVLNDCHYHGDISLIRFIELKIATNEEINDYLVSRNKSGWPMTEIEISLYQTFANMKNTLSIINQDISNSRTFKIDLLNKNNKMVLEI